MKHMLELGGAVQNHGKSLENSTEDLSGIEEREPELDYGVARISVG